MSGIAFCIPMPAKRYGYHYDQKEADAAYAHLRHVHGLPADAKAIYEG